MATKKKPPAQPEISFEEPKVAYMVTFGAMTNGYNSRLFSVPFESNLKGVEFFKDLKARAKAYASEALRKEVRYVWITYWKQLPI